MNENEQALKYIENCIKGLNADFIVSSLYEPFSYFVTVLLNDNQHTFGFARSIIDDFEVAIEKYRGSSYFNTIESAIKFSIYIELGSAGLLEEFEVSREIIKERREWIKKYPVDVFFNDEMTEVLHAGLESLLEFFESLLEEHPSLDLSDVEKHKECIKNLLRYYEKEGTLNSSGVGLENLQYLKAAALSQILDLEEKRRNERKPIIKRAMSKKIYDIVSQLRKAPFLDVELPDFVHDLIVE
jgi:hypothetical protein